jgi:hypothetical protein
MPSRAVAHAWTVVADKLVLDAQTNNFFICSVERIKVSLPPFPKGAKGVLVASPMEVLSLWYRVDSEKPGKAETRIRLLGPQNEELALSNQVVDLTTAMRVRSRSAFRALPISGEGILHFVTELKVSDGWREVSRVPLEVKVNWIEETLGSKKPTQTELPTTDTGLGNVERSTGRRARKRRHE